MDCLPWNIIIVDVWEIRKHKLYDSNSGSVCNSILSLHLGRGVVSLARMVYMSGQKGKVHLGPNVSSSAHICLLQLNFHAKVFSIKILRVKFRRGFAL